MNIFTESKQNGNYKENVKNRIGKIFLRINTLALKKLNLKKDITDENSKTEPLKQRQEEIIFKRYITDEAKNNIQMLKSL